MLIMLFLWAYNHSEQKMAENKPQEPRQLQTLQLDQKKQIWFDEYTFILMIYLDDTNSK